MGFKHSNYRTSSSPNCISIRSSSTIFVISALILFSFLYLFPSISRFSGESDDQYSHFSGDLRGARFPWNKLCFGPVPSEKLKLAVFSKSWPIGAAPGGMERHALTLYTVLAARGHEIHVFTVPSDRRPHPDVHHGNLHVYFAANDHGSVNISLAFDIFNQVKMVREFDYVHTESVSLPPWRAKAVPKLAVTWHGIWYEIMYSNLFQELLSNKNGLLPDPSYEFQESMPRLINEIRFFPSYTQHICISNSAGEALVNVYQIPQRNVHVILNGVDETKFVQDPEGGARFRKKHGVPDDASLVMGVAGRLVRDKGHPLLHEAFSVITKRNPAGVFLLVAGSGPWGRRYAELGANVKVLGALESSELSEFYNALDVFVNPTLRPQGLDLTLMEAMHCGKTILTPNFPSITGTVVLSEDFGYTFAPNVGSFVEALEKAIRDGSTVLQRKGMVCKKYAVSMFTANKMASAYERFFLCMKNPRYCQYPLATDC